ncbi:hypothetical protein [Parahaliea mediterranea]|uniref:hypothetical protein n=1 Tax=Parahaliea mediterranea TaxID=651086 RepID=UPI000E2FED39|nr:hypothetical protein [Parahaliea mediterranea]
MNPRPVALWAALLPFAAVHLTYLLAASHGLVDWCFPYTGACTSISATGREAPASYLFRATMLPAALLLFAYWWLNSVWLAALGSAAGPRRWMLVLAAIASLGLVAYVTVLGEAGAQWQRQRRIGVVLFFTFTYLAQLLLVAQLRRLQPQAPALRRLVAAMFGVCVLLLALGLVTVLWDALDAAGYDAVEDAFEWNLSLLLQTNVLLGYCLWRCCGWRLAVVRGGGKGWR